MRTGIRLAAATALLAGTGALTQAPAQAAACDSASGVTVVVDFDELGGGVQVACVPHGGDANELFVAAGHSLEQVQQQPGFVCRVDGLPTQEDEACVRTPPANAYWGLWWSDGDSGSWTYASQGVYSLDVPDGGSVALSWNNSSTREPPGAAPPDHTADEPSDQPSAPPSSGGGDGPGPGPGGSGGEQDGSSSSASTAPEGAAATGPSAARQRGAGREGSPDDGARDRRGKRDDRTRERGDRERDRRDASATEEAEDTTVPPGSEVTSEPVAAAAQGGVPGWVAPAGIVGLFAVAGVAAYLRRRAA